MADKKARTRLLVITIVLLVGLTGAIGYLLWNPSTSFSYFRTVSQVKKDSSLVGKSVRVGGMVIKGSIKKQDEAYRFQIGDGKNNIAVVYAGTMPSTFGAGVQAIVEGKLVSQHEMHAKSLVTKCPSKYESKKIGD